MKLNHNYHHDDDRIDEILFCSAIPKTTAESETTAFLRLSLAERYKTSGLSGDEWRFSSVLELRKTPDVKWVEVSGGYCDIETHTRALYAELYGDFLGGEKHQWLFRRKVGAIAFLWKGLPVYSASYDGAETDLLVACGHLPWALVKAREGGMTNASRLRDLCCQPGCRQKLVSVYRIKKDYCYRCGTGKEQSYYDSWVDVRGFCLKHLRRGDCGLDDADSNYEVVSGPRPDGNEPDSAVVKKSLFGGSIKLDL